ncbi:cupin fold metalloprotein, WbuC family [Paludibacter sp. 221]|uniref:WbuC family cupin fold metalloprotein n=1 Tax=Paludibacter sp. 221 TaxID=2302939 RepID=UPI0013D1EAF2|nr:WbuC family cupin fold metalloprotein [Paludibacter sp. 221]NDV47260.1 cupin fold metalloprotein, WbuC family [Paludibacter sp. 221]
MQLIDKELLDTISRQAKENERLRMNYNLHDSLDAPAQRLLNALEVGTNLPVHRHEKTAETYVLLQGEIKVIFYNDEKEIVKTTILNPLEGKFGVNILAGQWHTIEVLQPNSVIFEVKDGPYSPISKEDILEIE